MIAASLRVVLLPWSYKIAVWDMEVYIMLMLVYPEITEASVEELRFSPT